jgi:co-chaperonin GroES (HSP10)
MKKLLQDFLLVKKEELKKETDSGLLKPGTAKEKKSVAVVVEVSDDVSKKGIKVNDRVLCADHSVREVKIDGDTFNFVRYKDLIGVIS